MSKLIIITAPSGSGKTTIVKQLLSSNKKLAFSISACTRNPRKGEVDGIDYYFLTEKDFQNKIDQGSFLEWEMVYPGKYYGTLNSEITRLWNNNQVPIIDIDVKGALNVKADFPKQAISIFIKTPSLSILKERLINRGTEDDKSLTERMNKAEFELSFEQDFDFIVVNDKLANAVDELNEIIDNYLK